MGHEIARIFPKQYFLGDPLKGTNNKSGFQTACVPRPPQFAALQPWETGPQHDEIHVTRQSLLSNVDILYLRFTAHRRDSWITHLSDTLQDLQITTDILYILSQIL